MGRVDDTRQPDRKRGALVQRALNRDFATHHLAKTLADGQT